MILTSFATISNSDGTIRKEYISWINSLNYCEDIDKRGNRKVTPERVIAFETLHKTSSSNMGVKQYPDYIALPMISALTHIKGLSKNPERYKNIQFTRNLRDYQEDMAERSLSALREINACLLDMPAGSGKTVMGAYLSTSLKQRTAILMSVDLTLQWKNTFERFTTCNVLIYRPLTKAIMNNQTKLDNYVKEFFNADVVIFTVGKIVKGKKGSGDKRLNRTMSESFGLLIVDECDTMVASTGIHAIKQFYPHYTLFMTATPDRSNGLHKIYPAFVSDTRIRLERSKPFKFCTFHTNIPIVRKYTNDGIVSWADIVSQLSENQDRNEMIYNYCKTHHRRYTMVLTVEVDHVVALHKYFTEQGLDTATIKGNQKKVQLAEYTIATLAKCSRGYDHVAATGVIGSDIDHIVLVSTRKDHNPLEQIFGRAMRADDPIITMFIDDDSILRNHNRSAIQLCHRLGQPTFVTNKK